ncbi:hypothetical protein GCM10020227_02690 [Streptomyces flavovirens]
MIGIIDSAISSRFFQSVNESSLTVTGFSFELGGAHMLTRRKTWSPEGAALAGTGGGARQEADAGWLGGISVRLSGAVLTALVVGAAPVAVSPAPGGRPPPPRRRGPMPV